MDFSKRERKYRTKIIQEFHLNKFAQKKLDAKIVNTNGSYYETYKIFRILLLRFQFI